MDTSTIGTTLPPFVVAMLETADDLDIRTPIGGTEGEDVAVLFRFGNTVGSTSSCGELQWAALDSDEEAVEQFAREHEHTDRLYAYVADPNHDPRVLMVVAHGNISVDAAIAYVTQHDARVAMATQQEQQPASAPAVRAVGRATVQAGTVYQAASEPRTGMYL